MPIFAEQIQKKTKIGVYPDKLVYRLTDINGTRRSNVHSFSSSQSWILISRCSYRRYYCFPQPSIRRITSPHTFETLKETACRKWPLATCTVVPDPRTLPRQLEQRPHPPDLNRSGKHRVTAAVKRCSVTSKEKLASSPASPCSCWRLKGDPAPDRRRPA